MIECLNGFGAKLTNFVAKSLPNFKLPILKLFIVQQIMFLPITFTEAAKTEVLKTLNSPQIPAGYALRVGLKGGACSATYLIGLDKPTENDEIYNIENIKVIIDKRHLMYLIGVQVGYEISEDGEGFTLEKSEIRT